MPSSVAIEVVIEDDEFNAPEMRIGKTIVVKVPLHSNIETIHNKIEARFPVLRDSKVMYYFFDNNGLKTTIYSSLAQANFWQHQESISEGLCVLHVNAMLLKHPKKNCNRCGGGLYGRYVVCECRDFFCCTTCIEDEEPECPAHKKEYIWCEFVSIPDIVEDKKEKDLIHEILEHGRFLIRQQAVANGQEPAQ